MDEELKQRLQKKSTWMRAVYMLMFAIIFGLLEVVIATIVVFQFFLSLFTGNTNERMVQLGQSLSTYLYQITLFLTLIAKNIPIPLAPGQQAHRLPPNQNPNRQHPKLRQRQHLKKVQKPVRQKLKSKIKRTDCS